jgi:D-tyrosyl-tRNA(Tyr) deacylase
MRAVLQRVLEARVDVEGKTVGACGPGFLLLVGVHRNDTPAQAEKLADRIAGLRVFSDADGKMNLSLPASEGAAQILAISNFTVYGDALSSRRPSFTASAPYEQGKRLFELFVAALGNKGLTVATGEFGADMQVFSVNDGPVTLVIDVENPVAS